MNIQELFRLCLELLSLDFYDSVHLLLIGLQVIPAGEDAGVVFCIAA